MPSRTAALVLLFVAVVAAPAAAQWSGDPAANTPVCTEPGLQWRPAAVPDGDGGMLLVWSDDRPGAPGLYAQRLDRLGDPQWGAGGVRVASGVFQWRGEVASDGAGGMVFAWSDSAAWPSPVIRAQRLSTAGGLTWGPQGVAVSSLPTTRWLTYDVRIAVGGDGAGGAAIAWADSGERLMVQVLDASGQRAWPQEVRLDDGPCYDHPRVVPDGSGGAIACWRRAASGIAAQRVDATGTTRWDAGVSDLDGPGNGSRPNLVTDGAGGAVASWLEYAAAPPYRRLHVQRLDSLGAPQWGPSGPNVASAYVESDTLLADGQGGVFIAWLDDGRGRAQHLDSSGAPQWAAGGAPFDTGYVYRATTVLVPAPDGGVHVSWYSYATHGMRVQRLSAAGSRSWGVAGLPLSTHAMSFGGWTRALAPDGAGGLLAAWEDSRNHGSTGTDLYAQRWNARGALSVEPPATPSRLALAAGPVPAPRGAGVALRLSLPAAARVRVTIHDAAGRLVRVLEDGAREAGTHLVPWDGRDRHDRAVPPGLYFVRARAGAEAVAARLVVAG